MCSGLILLDMVVCIGSERADEDGWSVIAMESAPARAATREGRAAPKSAMDFGFE